MFCPNPAKETDKPYPEGYLEALEDCNALAVNLLQKALTGEDIKRCWDCASWVWPLPKGNTQSDCQIRSVRLVSAKVP